MYSGDKNSSGADLGFLKGTGVAGTSGLQNQWSNCQQNVEIRKLELTEKTVALEILAMKQGRKYNEVPVQRVCLYSCRNTIVFI